MLGNTYNSTPWLLQTLFWNIIHYGKHVVFKFSPKNWQLHRSSDLGSSCEGRRHTVRRQKPPGFSNKENQSILKTVVVAPPSSLPEITLWDRVFTRQHFLDVVAHLFQAQEVVMRAKISSLPIVTYSYLLKWMPRVHQDKRESECGSTQHRMQGGLYCDKPGTTSGSACSMCMKGLRGPALHIPASFTTHGNLGRAIVLTRRS